MMKKRTIKTMERALDYMYDTSVYDRADIADACKDLPVSRDFRDKIESRFENDLNDIVMMQGSSDVLRDIFEGFKKSYKGE